MMEEPEEVNELNISVELSLRDVPAFMRVIEASAELVRQANTLGFVDGKAPEITELHRALVCLSPDLEVGDE